ncbi:MAG: ABC transporter substrate-binding protein, partial [Acidimicrobiales bacterium]
LFDKTVADLAPKVGFQVAFQAKATLTAPDYTSNCIQARNEGVQALITSLDAQTNHRLLASCAKVGLKIPLASASLQGSYDYADDPNMDGTIIGHNTRPWFAADNPAIAAYLTALKRFAKGEDAKPGPGSINGWVSAKVFERAARGIAPGAAATGADVAKGLYALGGDDIDGLTYPLRFAPGQTKKKIACGYPVVSDGKGKFTSEAKMTCLPGYEP